jgi:DAACS family dicarboxylate/amino acid:cation (Na+ or H+) symporter
VTSLEPQPAEPTPRQKEERKKIPLVVRLLLAILLGMLTGLALGPKAAVLGEIGLLAIKLLKALATPLMFFAVVDSFCRAHFPAKKGAILLVVCLVNAIVAGALAIGLSRLISPGTRVDAEAFRGALEGSTSAPPGTPRMDALGALRDLVPESVPEPFLKNQVLTIVLLAVIVGVALRTLRARGSGDTLFKLIEEAFELLGVILQGVIALVPVAVFGVVAKVVGTSGFGIFASLGALVGTVALGLGVHVLVYYAVLVAVLGRRSPFTFFRRSASALMTAFATGSSMATLPVTLRTLEKELDVGHDSARLAACVGTNFNNDGIMLYEVVAALFIAQVNGVALSGGQKVQVAITSALAAAGIAGVPEAGLITLSLVLTSVGLPLSSLPVLLTVDWLLGRLRAMTNVTSDLVVATVLDALGGRAAPKDG